jgi:hypothetical protein
MRCFNHSENRAVGLCKNCLKGVCPDCLSDTGNGLACKTACEERVKALDDYNDLAMTQGLKSLTYIQKSGKGTSLFALILGVLFIIGGLFLVPSKLWLLGIFNCLLGGMFVFQGLNQRKALK